MDICLDKSVFQVIGIPLIVTIGGLAFGEVAEAVVGVTHTLIVAQAVVDNFFRWVVDKVACRVKVKGVPLCSAFLLLNPSQAVVLLGIYNAKVLSSIIFNEVDYSFEIVSKLKILNLKTNNAHQFQILLHDSFYIKYLQLLS